MNRIDRIYAAPREDFITERDALAKELRAGGDVEEAARIKALRKPTLVAWALNEVSRRQPDSAARLLDLQEKMQQATTSADLREASGERQEVLTSLTEAAVGVLNEAGHGGDQTADRLALTLLALGTNQDAAEQFRLGRLHEEVAPGDVWETSMPPVPTSKGEGDDGSRRLERAQAELAALEAAAAKLEERARRAAQRLDEARRDAETTRAAAAAARADADRSARAVAEAERTTTDG